MTEHRPSARILARCRWLALWAALAPLPAAAAEITVLGLFPDMAVVEIDGERRTLRAGQTSPEGVRLIEADSETATLEVDGERLSLGLGSPSVTTRFETSRPVARIWPTGGMYRTEGSINRQPVKFLVDTGATWVAMDPAHAERLGIDYRSIGKVSSANTASGLVRVYEVVLDRVRVGGIELRGVKAAVIDNAAARDTILLGMSFLERVEMQRQGEVLQLRRKY